MKQRPPKNRSTGDLAAALRALRRLGANEVERCPQPDCAVCRPARRAA